jgi:hypothetical protein
MPLFDDRELEELTGSLGRLINGPIPDAFPVAVLETGTGANA